MQRKKHGIREQHTEFHILTRYFFFCCVLFKSGLNQKWDTWLSVISSDAYAMLCHAQFLLKLYQVYELTVSSEGETELNRKTLMKYSMKLPKKNLAMASNSKNNR